MLKRIWIQYLLVPVILVSIAMTPVVSFASQEQPTPPDYPFDSYFFDTEDLLLGNSFFERQGTEFWTVAALSGGTTGPSGPAKVFFDTSERSLATRMIWKFCRGNVNLISAFWELLNQPFIYASNQEQLLGVCTGLGTGFIVGVGWMFARIGIGLFDIVTFPFPIKNYQTIIYPEFVF